MERDGVHREGSNLVKTEQNGETTWGRKSNRGRVKHRINKAGHDGAGQGVA